MKPSTVGRTKNISAKTALQLKRAFSALGLFSLLLVLSTLPIAQSKDCSNYPKTPVNFNVSEESNQLSVLLYNTQLRPRLLFASSQSDRVQRLVPLLAGYDVVVLSEVFDDRSLRELSTLHSYQSVSLPLGQNEGLSQDSGLAVFSQWPMLPEEQKQRLFDGDCEGNSCFNYQGVLAIAFKKDEAGSTYRIITAQMQAGDSQKAIAIRASQYQQIRQFIDDLNIPPNEPTILAVSLPISPQARPDELTQMQTTIGLELVDTEDASIETTRDRPIAHSSQALDALFTLNRDEAIQLAKARTRPMRTSPQQGWKSAPWFYWQCPQQDLSDRPAVEGTFRLRR